VRADQQTLTELLRCLPVTQEAAGSSPVAPAKFQVHHPWHSSPALVVLSPKCD